MVLMVFLDIKIFIKIMSSDFSSKDTHSKELSEQYITDMGHPPFSVCFQGVLHLDLLYSLSLLIIQIVLFPGQGVSFSAFDEKLHAG